LARFEFESGIVLSYFSFIFVSFGELSLIVSWRACGRCGMTCSDENCGRSRRPGAEDRGWSHRSGTRWPGDFPLTIGVMCGLHRARGDEECRFLG
jgi:hypothetical protein